MNINLPPEELDYLERQVAAGRYSSIEEAVVGSVRLLREEQQELQEEHRAAIQEALDGVDQGDYIEIHTEEELTALFDAVSRGEAHKLIQRPS